MSLIDKIRDRNRSLLSTVAPPFGRQHQGVGRRSALLFAGAALVAAACLAHTAYALDDDANIALFLNTSRLEVASLAEPPLQVGGAAFTFEGACLQHFPADLPSPCVPDK